MAECERWEEIFEGFGAEYASIYEGIEAACKRIAALEQQLAEAVADREVLARFFVAWTDATDAYNPVKETADALIAARWLGLDSDKGRRLYDLGHAAEQRAAGGAE